MAAVSSQAARTAEQERDAGGVQPTEPPPSAAPTPSWPVRHWTPLLGVLGTALFTLNVVAVYPAFLSYDSVEQFGQAIGARQLSDWHPPVMTALWSLLMHLPLHPAVPMLLAQLGLLWGSLLLLAVYVHQETASRKLSLLPLVLGVLPYVANISGDIWKDDQLAFALLAAVVVLLHVRRGIERAWLRWAALTGVALLLAYAAAVRYNALPALVPLLFLVRPAARKARVRYRVLLAGAVLAGLLGATPAISAVRPVLATHPAGSIMLDDVLHVYRASDLRSADVSGSLKRSLLSLQHRCPPGTMQINYTWRCPTSGDITEFFTTQFDYGEMRHLYLSGIAEHPIRYLKYRAVVYATFLDPSPAESLVWSGRIHNNSYGLTFTPNVLTNRLQDYVGRAFGNAGFLFKPWFWLVAGIALLAWAFRRRRAYGHASVVMVLSASALVYIVCYVPMVIGYDYRYIYWSAIGLSVGGILLLADRSRRGRDVGPEIADHL